MAQLEIGVGRSAAAETSTAEAEWVRKRAVINRYLSGEGGRDFCSRTQDRDKWSFAGDGSVKRVYQPLSGPLRDLQICLRENVTVGFNPYDSAHELRKETRFLQRVRSRHFPKVYAYTPFRSGETSELGQYNGSRHRDVVDFIRGTKVEQISDLDPGIVWPKELTPAARLNVVLAACWCENEATSLTPPVYLTDLKTDAFIVQPDGLVKLVDTQPQGEYAEASQHTIAIELVRLCLELFPGERHYGTTGIERAIHGYLEPDWDREDRRYLGKQNQPPTLDEVIRSADLPGGTERAIKDFLIWVRGRPAFNHVASYFRRAIQPIADRLEREESRARVDEAERQMRAEAARRTEGVLFRSDEALEAEAREEVDLLVWLSDRAQQGEKVVPVVARDSLKNFLVCFDKLTLGSRRRLARNCYPQESDDGVALSKLYSYVLSTAIDLGGGHTGVETLLPVDIHPGRVAVDAMKEILGLRSELGVGFSFRDDRVNKAFFRLIEALHRMTPAERDLLAEHTTSKNIYQLYADLVATVVGTRE